MFSHIYLIRHATCAALAALKVIEAEPQVHIYVLYVISVCICIIYRCMSMYMIRYVGSHIYAI